VGGKKSERESVGGKEEKGGRRRLNGQDSEGKERLEVEMKGKEIG